MTIPRMDMPGFSFDPEQARAVIPLPGEFSFDETLHYLTRSTLECLHQVEDRTVYKLLEYESQPFLLKITELGGSALQLQLAGNSPCNAGALEFAAGYVTEWFDLRTDLSAFYRMAESDPLLGSLTRDYRGLRIVGVPDLFEALCWAVTGQQINLTFAYTLKKRLVEAFGMQVQWNGRAYWLYPKPQDLADAHPGQLKQLQFTGKKAEFLIGIAQLMESGELTKNMLLAQTDSKKIESQLTAVRGIGPWTANYVLMRCLRSPSAFPIGDAGLHNALKQLLNREHKPAEEEIRRIFSPWQGWEAYAVFYLWRSL